MKSVPKPVRKISDKAKSKINKPTRSQGANELRRVFSLYIRQKAAWESGKLEDVKCVTCETRSPWRYMQAGHFFSSRYQGTRWDEMNVHCQCARCNCTIHKMDNPYVWKSGNLLEYSLFMIRTYGEEAVKRLEFKAKSKSKISAADIQLLIRHYMNLLIEKGWETK